MGNRHGTSASAWLGRDYLGPDPSPYHTFMRLYLQMCRIRDGSALRALEMRTNARGNVPSRCVEKETNEGNQ